MDFKLKVCSCCLTSLAGAKAAGSLLSLPLPAGQQLIELGQQARRIGAVARVNLQS